MNSVIVRLRSVINNYIECHQYKCAVYWADKLASLSNEDPSDIYLLCKTLYLAGQYRRCCHLIKKFGLDQIHPPCLLMAARCYYMTNEVQAALELLDSGGDASVYSAAGKPRNSTQNIISKRCSLDWGGMTKTQVESAICLLQGYIYEKLENRSLASNSFREALKLDVFCFEAMENLTRHQMLTGSEEIELLDSLPVSNDLSIVRNLYEGRLKKYDKSLKSFALLSSLPANLKSNLDVQVEIGERLLFNCLFESSLKTAESVLKEDPCHPDGLALKVACLVELERSSELFYLAHKLVDQYPDWALAWFAVGAYYFVIGKQEPARRFLTKATTLERLFAPAWLLYGHSFAVEGEHDQAMAAYFTSSKLMPGCHLPLLYIGQEYGVTNNASLADKFMREALVLAPDDPCTLHELGVVLYESGKYEEAERCMSRAFSRLTEDKTLVSTWEPLLNNLGHVSRRLGRLDASISFHLKALSLRPLCAGTHSSLGLTYSLKCDWASAIDSFHRALGLSRDDSFADTMLKEVILRQTKSPCDISQCNIDLEFSHELARLKGSCPKNSNVEESMELSMDMSLDMN